MMERLPVENRRTRSPSAWLFFGLACSVLLGVSGESSIGQQEKDGLDAAQKTRALGVSKMIEQIVLPGTLLTHRKVDPTTSPLMVRVVRSFPHGDAFRYDISYFGMTPGEFDLRDFLQREDGSPTGDLPPIPVTINTILGEGQIEPNELEVGGLSAYGGYWKLLILGGTVWVGILALLIFAGRKRKQEQVVELDQPLTLSELLKPAVEKAIAGELPEEKHAELERLLFTFWQKKLGLSDGEPADVLRQIRSHSESGPLVRQVESWLHSPPGAAEDVDVARLLEPYRKYDATELEEEFKFPPADDRGTGG